LRVVRVVLTAALVAAAAEASAHEVRPAYLALTETAPGRLDVVWKVPTIGGGVPLAGEEVPHAGVPADAADPGEPRTMPCGCPAPTASDMTFGALPIHPALPAAWRVVAPPRLEQLPGAVIRRWTVVAGESGIEGATVAVHGLDVAMVDVLVRVERRRTRGVPRAPPRRALVHDRAGATIPVLGYLRLGSTHLFGIDHLLFVLGLILLVGELALS
jgi:hypothetical protein